MHHLSAEQQLFILYQIRNWVFGRYDAFRLLNMLLLARYSFGRVVLHLVAMSRNGEIRFHGAGILRECGIRAREGNQ